MQLVDASLANGHDGSGGSSRVVVTGGAGFLGSHVVRRLLAGGNHVVVLDDFSHGKMENLECVAENPRLEIVSGDVVAEEDVARAFQGASVVVHLAVLGLRQSIKDPARVKRVIIDGTLTCLDAAVKNGVELFVNCSSSEVYGSAKYVPMDEAHPLHPTTPYAAAKVAQDMYVASYGYTYELPWVTIRPFNMYGPNSHWEGPHGEVIPKMIVRAMNGKPMVIFGEGEQTRDFNYVEDAAEAVIKVAGNPGCREQVVNFCTGREVSIRRIAELVCENLGLDASEMILHQAGRPADVARHMGDNSKFTSIFGHTPTTQIEDGLKRTIDWFINMPVEPSELLSQEVVRNWE